MSREVRLHWADKRDNFGDILTPYLLRHYLHMRVTWAERDSADVYGIGSIIERMPPLYSGIIIGTGRMFESTPMPDLSRARILGLRGRLTAGNMRVPLFDLGVLAHLFCGVHQKRYSLGVVPWYRDRALREAYPDAHYIDIQGGVPYVVNEIAKCRVIVTSSLHAMIAADSLGVAYRLELQPEYERTHWFKFEDYKSAGTVRGQQRRALQALHELRRLYR